MKFMSLTKSTKFVTSGKPMVSTIAALGQAANQSSGCEKIVCSLFCIFITIASSISFVVLSNHLYLNP